MLSWPWKQTMTSHIFHFQCHSKSPTLVLLPLCHAAIKVLTKLFAESNHRLHSSFVIYLGICDRSLEWPSLHQMSSPQISTQCNHPKPLPFSGMWAYFTHYGWWTCGAVFEKAGGVLWHCTQNVCYARHDNFFFLLHLTSTTNSGANTLWPRCAIFTLIAHHCPHECAQPPTSMDQFVNLLPPPIPFSPTTCIWPCWLNSTTWWVPLHAMVIIISLLLPHCWHVKVHRDTPLCIAAHTNMPSKVHHLHHCQPTCQNPTASDASVILPCMTATPTEKTLLMTTLSFASFLLLPSQYVANVLEPTPAPH